MPSTNSVASSAMGKGDSWEKSAACHSPIWVSCSMPSRWKGNSRVLTPKGVSIADAMATARNAPQRKAVRLRSLESSTASAPSAPANASPKAKLPCRLAQSGMTGISHQPGGVFFSRAATRPAVHSASSGSDRVWGRASRLPATQARPSTTVSKAGTVSSRLRTAWAAMPAASAMAAANSRWMPGHPPGNLAPRQARAMTISASHSWACQGAPALV